MHTQQDTEAVVVSSVEEMVEVVSPAEMVDAEEVVEEMEAAAAELNYFCGHRDRLGYAARLRRGSTGTLAVVVR